MDTKHIAIGEALKFGWRSWQGNIVWWLGFFATVVIGYLIVGFLDARAGNTADPTLGLVVFIAGILFQSLFSLAYTAASLKFTDGQRPRAAELVQTYPLLLKFIGANILYNLIILVGLVLLIVPGIIWAIKYQFFGYIVVDQKLGPLAALKASGRLTDGVKWELLGFNIVAVLINAAGALLLIVGLVATVPTTLIATVYLYRTLQQQMAMPKTPPPTSTSRAAAAPPAPA